MKTYKLYLLRHGLTQGNLDRIYVGGGLDLPLCAEGHRQLEQIKAQYTYPNVGLVFSSPMLRALQSAEILYPAMEEKIVLEELRECRFGEFEGKSMDELAQNESFARWLNPESGYVPKGGESGQAFAARTARAMGIMLEHMARSGIGQAACITHGGVIASMMSQKALPRKPGHQWLTDNGTGFALQADAAMIMRDGLVEAVDIVPFGYGG